jgi:hypothetical protein
MTDINRDPDKNWRRIFRLLHSPGVLLPTVTVGICVALSDLPDTVVRRGWLWGTFVGLIVLVGMVITILDLVPWLVEWLLTLHRKVDRAMDQLGGALDAAVQRVRRIVGSPPGDRT